MRGGISGCVYQRTRPLVIPEPFFQAATRLADVGLATGEGYIVHYTLLILDESLNAFYAAGRFTSIVIPGPINFLEEAF